jgi:hypothetical protein
MVKIVLPPRDTDKGAEIRLLMAECRGPSFTAIYNLTDAKRCMQHMDLVIWNRLANHPGKFGAPGATSIRDIIKAPGQFAGFGNYPKLSAGMVANLQQMIDIANNPKDSRQSDFADFINAAIDVTNAQTIADPTGAGNILSAWRTAGASSPGSGFTKFSTIMGTDFYSSVP